MEGYPVLTVVDGTIMILGLDYLITEMLSAT